MIRASAGSDRASAFASSQGVASRHPLPPGSGEGLASLYRGSVPPAHSDRSRQPVFHLPHALPLRHVGASKEHQRLLFVTPKPGIRDLAARRLGFGSGSAKLVTGTMHRCSMPSQRFQCGNVSLRMLVLLRSASMRINSSRLAGLPLAMSLSAFVFAAFSAQSTGRAVPIGRGRAVFCHRQLRRIGPN